MSNTKDGKKNGLLWFFVILLVGAALVILGLTFMKKDTGTAFNVKDVSLVESAKTSVAVSVDAKGDGLRYYYSLDGKNYIEGNSSYTFTGLKEGTTYTVYVKVVDKDGTEKISKLSVKTAGKKQEETKEEEKKEEEEEKKEEQQQGGYTPYYPVTPAEPTVTFGLAEASRKINYGNTNVIKINVTGENYGTLSCSSSDEELATCALNGATLIITPELKSGKAVITVSENKKDKKAYFELTVSAELVSMDITANPTKTSYIEEETLSIAGMVVMGTFSDGSTAQLSASEFVTVPAAGTKLALANDGASVLVKSKDGQINGGSFTVNVSKKTSTKIEVTKLPFVSDFKEETALRLAGLEVTVLYNNGTKAVLATNEYTTTPIDGTILQLGDDEVLIDYYDSDLEEHRTATLAIHVSEKELANIEIETLPTQEFYQGQEFDVDGGVLKLNYDNDTYTTIPMTTEMVAGYDKDQIGEQTLTVTYEGKITTYTIEVVDVILNHIAITTMPTTTGYIEGQLFSFAGMIVTGYYSDGSDDVVMDWTATVNGNESFELVKGDNTIVVSYGGKSAEAFTVVAAEKQINGINIITEPENEYIEGQKLDLTGLEVVLCYNNGKCDETPLAKNEFQTTPLDQATLTLDDDLVVVTYNDGDATFTNSFELYVSKKQLVSAIIKTEPKTEYYIGEKLDVSDLVVTATYDNETTADIAYNAEDFDFDFDLNQTLVIEDDETEIAVSYKGEDAGSFTITVSPIPTYKINFAVNEAARGTIMNGETAATYIMVPEGTEIATNNEAITINGANFIATPTAKTAQYTYSFTDWTNGCGETMGTEECTITANFSQAINKYTITWKNYDDTVLETDTEVEFGTTPSYDGSDPVKSADEQYTYTFNGWDPAIANVEGDATYTATYGNTLRSYAVTFNMMGHGTAIEQLTVDYGAKVTEPTAPTANGYTFDGWYKEEALTNAWDFSSDTIASETTLYAKWSIVTYNITYVLNEGTNPETVPTTYTIETATFDLPTPTKDIEHIFGGWYNNEELDGDAISSIVIGSFGDVVLYAKWLDATPNIYTLNYDGNSEGATNVPEASVSKPTYNIIYGAVLDVNTIPALDGYEFVGYANSNDATEADYAYDNGTFTPYFVSLDKDNPEKTVYAVWKEAVSLPEYSRVEYVRANGGAYLNTGYAPTKNTKVEITFAFVSVTGPKDAQFVFGSTLDSSDNYQGIQYGFSQSADFPNSSSYRMGQKKVTIGAIDLNKHTFIFDAQNQTFSRDGMSYTDSYTWSTKTNRPMYLFASNQGTTYTSRGNVKIYSFKIYESGTLKKEYVPYYNWEDNMYGFMEMKSKTFLTGTTSSQFTGGEKYCEDGELCYVHFDGNGIIPNKAIEVTTKDKIPVPTTPVDDVYNFAGWYKDKNYTEAWDFENDIVTGPTYLYAKWDITAQISEVPYVENGNSGYIATGYVPNANTGIELDYQLLKLPPQTGAGIKDETFVLGSLVSDAKGGYNGVQIGFGSSAMSQKKLSIRFGTENNMDNAFNLGRHTIRLNETTRQIIYDDGAPGSKLGAWDTAHNPTAGMLVFATVQPAKYTSPEDSIRIYSLKIYESGSIVKNYIPALSSTGEYGLWETTSSTFLSTAVPETNLKGADLPESPVTHEYYYVLPYKK